MQKFRKGERVRCRDIGAITDGRVGRVDMQWRDEDGTRLVGVFIYGLSYVVLRKEDELEAVELDGKQATLTVPD